LNIALIGQGNNEKGSGKLIFAVKAVFLKIDLFVNPENFSILLYEINTLKFGYWGFLHSLTLVAIPLKPAAGPPNSRYNHRFLLEGL